LTADPELRFLPNGKPLARFTLACSDRFMVDGEWKDGDTSFLDCTVWDAPAEHVAESLSRGLRVLVSGRLKMREYEANDGTKRRTFEVTVTEVGPSLKFATATVKRVTRSEVITTEPRAIKIA
jgi:single-strand DNA-binding protein